MGAVIGELLPIAVVIAISPVPIVVVILLRSCGTMSAGHS
jgi:hypothetical protein